MGKTAKPDYESPALTAELRARCDSDPALLRQRRTPTYFPRTRLRGKLFPALPE